MKMIEILQKIKKDEELKVVKVIGNNNGSIRIFTDDCYFLTWYDVEDETNLNDVALMIKGALAYAEKTDIILMKYIDERAFTEDMESLGVFGTNRLLLEALKSEDLVADGLDKWYPVGTRTYENVMNLKGYIY